jgi:hypothetical protein
MKLPFRPLKRRPLGESIFAPFWQSRDAAAGHPPRAAFSPSVAHPLAPRGRTAPPRGGWPPVFAPGLGPGPGPGHSARERLHAETSAVSEFSAGASPHRPLAEAVPPLVAAERLPLFARFWQRHDPAAGYPPARRICAGCRPRCANAARGRIARGGVASARVAQRRLSRIGGSGAWRKTSPARPGGRGSLPGASLRAAVRRGNRDAARVMGTASCRRFWATKTFSITLQFVFTSLQQ